MVHRQYGIGLRKSREVVARGADQQFESQRHVWRGFGSRRNDDRDEEEWREAGADCNGDIRCLVEKKDMLNIYFEMEYEYCLPIALNLLFHKHTHFLKVHFALYHSFDKIDD